MSGFALLVVFGVAFGAALHVGRGRSYAGAGPGRLSKGRRFLVGRVADALSQIMPAVEGRRVSGSRQSRRLDLAFERDTASLFFRLDRSRLVLQSVRVAALRGGEITARLGRSDGGPLGGRGGITTGVPWFDAAYRVTGSPTAVLSRLNEAGRAVVADCIGPGGVTIERGVLTGRSRIGHAAGPEELVSWLQERSRRLHDTPTDPAEALANHAVLRPDPEPGYRRACFEMLLARCGASEWTERAREAATEPNLRLLDARLRGLLTDSLAAELLATGELDEDLRLRAATQLGPERAGQLAVLEDAASHGQLSLAQDGGASLSDPPHDAEGDPRDPSGLPSE